MRENEIVIDGTTFAVEGASTVVVGSGAAGLKAALTLHDLGQRDVLVVTERWGAGASANAGSDKQTYYKLAVAGGQADSPRQMAEDLFAGRAMHGDIALCEAQHSAQAFYQLVALGVPFPHDVYGGYPGYRTDHDPRGRATSAGPLTSHLMVGALGRALQDRGVCILDRHAAVALLVDRRQAEPSVAGLVALSTGNDPRFVLIAATNVVLATGGPGMMYADSVYPEGQDGSIGLALRAGAPAQNLTESQFGIASVGVRWNLSGSYQQVVPRYVSTAADGSDAREFLPEAFPDMARLATAVFLKGYQWPFDPRKVEGHGSSLIDILVHRERVVRGRRVFLDFTRNPDGGAHMVPFSVDQLAPEARFYLEQCGATGPTPIARLRQMNEPAIELYRRRGIDLARDLLEIAVCAQHNNGGLKANHWWESPIRGLFPVGEINGSHGVYRPGGAALNAGQVGALRAAMLIARRRTAAPRSAAALAADCDEQIRRTVGFGRRASSTHADAADGDGTSAGLAVGACLRDIQARMSRCGGHIRDGRAIGPAAADAWALAEAIEQRGVATSPEQDLREAFRVRDLALAHAVYLESIAEYIAHGGQSRGSFLVVDPGGRVPAPGLEDWAFTLSDPRSDVDRHVLEVRLGDEGRVEKTWTPVRPIPDVDHWFENVWKAYREDHVIGE